MFTLIAAAVLATPLPTAPEGRAAPVEAPAPNRIFVLGTPHLTGWPKDVPLDTLRPLIDRLAAWKPQMIAIEAIPGDQCWLMRHEPKFVDEVDSYCPDTRAARAATGLDVPEAMAERDRMLAAWPAAPTAAQRRRLAAVMLAAGDPSSALVQWLRLDPARRHVGDGLDTALVDHLRKREQSRNESDAVAARLAARLGLERLVQMDDQGTDTWVVDDDAYGKAVGAAWKAHAGTLSEAEAAARGPGLYTPDGVLAAYRLYNSPEFARVAYARDWGAALTDRSAAQYGRRYVTYWETRNLRMAANIREALGERPGSRMLVIVGASHKAYLDDYLGRMRDAEIVDAQTILG